MSGDCNNRCITHPLAGQKKRYRGMYLDGRIYCKNCQYCAEYDGIYCPCCNRRVRRNPTNHKMCITIREVKRI